MNVFEKGVQDMINSKKDRILLAIDSLSKYIVAINKIATKKVTCPREMIEEIEKKLSELK